MSRKVCTIFRCNRHVSCRSCKFLILWAHVSWQTSNPGWRRRFYSIFNWLRKPSALYVCLTLHLESFISLFQTNMAGQCICRHIRNLASIVNIFIETLISGRGRYLHLLSLVEGELETLWEESLTIPTCLNGLRNIITLMNIVIKAYRIPPPTIPL